MSDASGNMVVDSDVLYAPYGEIRGSNTLPELTDFGFTGQTLDRSTDGLMYYGARYYLPELRRFISADTIVPGAGKPQDLNRYSYVVNNPIKYVDPTGNAYIMDEEEWEFITEPIEEPILDPILITQEEADYYHTYDDPVAAVWLMVAAELTYMEGSTETVEELHPYLKSQTKEPWDWREEIFTDQPGSADYVRVQLNASLAFTGAVILEPFAVGLSYAEDRYGNQYWGWTVGLGEGLLGSGLDAGIGWLDNQPTPEADVQNFLAGPSLNADIGALFGTGITWAFQNVGNGSKRDDVAGVLTVAWPQVGISFGQTYGPNPWPFRANGG